MRIWNDPKERLLLILSIVLFVALCSIEAQLPLIIYLKDTWIGEFLTNASVKNISSSLIVGVLAAYFFYLFIDLLPRVRREQKTKIVLNSLLASVLDAYNRCRIFGHETPISHVDNTVLTREWLADHKNKLEAGNVKFLPLKFAMQTAFTRLEDFRHALPLAITLSPEDAMRWLVIIDKVRLFSESYGEQPEIPEDKSYLVDTDSEDNPVLIYKSDLNFRFLEFVTQVIGWVRFGDK